LRGENPGELIHIDIKKLGRIDCVGQRITGDRKGHSEHSRGTRPAHFSDRVIEAS
jgi:hypothetical protein